MADQGTPTLSSDGFQAVEESSVEITEAPTRPDEDHLSDIVHAVGSVLEPQKAPMLLTTITVIGFVVISYSGNMKLVNLLFYMLFLLFSGVFYLVLDSLINNTIIHTKIRLFATLALSLILSATIYVIGRYNLADKYYYASLVIYLTAFMLLWFKELKRM